MDSIDNGLELAPPPWSALRMTETTKNIEDKNCGCIFDNKRCLCHYNNAWNMPTSQLPFRLLRKTLYRFSRIARWRPGRSTWGWRRKFERWVIQRVQLQRTEEGVWRCNNRPGSKSGIKILRPFLFPGYNQRCQCYRMFSNAAVRQASYGRTYQAKNRH